MDIRLRARFLLAGLFVPLLGLPYALGLSSQALFAALLAYVLWAGIGYGLSIYWLICPHCEAFLGPSAFKAVVRSQRTRCPHCGHSP